MFEIRTIKDISKVSLKTIFDSFDTVFETEQQLLDIAYNDFFNKEIKSQTMKEKLKRFASDNFHIRYRETLCVIGEAVRFNCNHFGKDKKELCDVRI